MKRPFLKTREVAELVGVSQKHVLRCINTGKLSAVQCGRQWRVRPASVTKWRNEIQNACTGLVEPGGRDLKRLRAQAAGESPALTASPTGGASSGVPSLLEVTQ